MMNFNWLENPQNLWGSWVNTPMLKKIGGIIGLSSLVLSQPLWQSWSQSTRQTELQQALQQQEEQLAHQQRLLENLKQQSQRNLTPALARRLPPINEQIQALAADLQLIHSQWLFQTEPQLSLQLQGQFPKLRQFLTALLEANELKLVSWQISQLTAEERNETQSISSQIILQLQKETQ